MTKIHKTAIIDPSANIGKDVEIGAYAYVGEEVTIGDGTILKNHASIDKWATIGKNCTIFPFASISAAPQDLKYKGEKSFVTIGDNNTIRECVTINRGTFQDEVTLIGSNNLFMAYSHVGHNCILGNNIVIANSGTLAGHVEIEDNVVIGGLTGIHQFCHVGKMAMIGGCSKVIKDILPYNIADGHPAAPRGLNILGLRRNGIAKSEISALKNAFKIIFKQNLNTTQALELLSSEIEDSAAVTETIEFIKKSNRGISKKGDANE